MKNKKQIENQIKRLEQAAKFINAESGKMVLLIKIEQLKWVLETSIVIKP